MRGADDRTRAEEYHGREAVKQTTRAAQEEFTGELEAKAEQADADLRDPSLYINRELSMLDFFERVLDEARDTNNPLLERVKFIGIVGSILGEFFMVRIAGLRQQVEAGVTEAAADGYTPQQLLPLAQERAWGIMKAARQCFSELKPELEAAGINLVDYADLDAVQKASLRRYYEEQVFPVLTPLAFDPGRPFPHISNMSHNLGVLTRDANGDEHFARVKVPDSLPRLVPVAAPAGADAGDDGVAHQWFTWLEQVIAANLATLFPGMEVLESHAFRVTRDAELAIQELEADDLLETIEQFVRRRRFGSVIRVTIDETMPEGVRDILKENLELGDTDVYAVRSPLGLSSLWGAGSIDRHELKYAPLVQSVPSSLAGLEGSELFAAIRHRDVLLHHPYDSFDPVVEFLRAAADDPDVLAIKQTLYRCGRNAPAVEQLMEAAANGKDVAVLVELKARFDEESNIGWAKALEREGAHVVYGLIGLKTHCKALQVVRREGDRIRRYTHLGTGNYNSVTTKQYTDLGLLHRRRRHRRRRQPGLQPPHRWRAGHHVPQAAGGAGQPAPGHRRPHRPRDRPRRGRARGPPHLQDELAGGQADDPQAVPRLAGRREDRAQRARHVLSAARSARRERDHHRAERGGPLPRAQPRVLVPQRRRRRGHPRQRRPHAAQPQPAGRDPLPGAGQGHRAAHPRRDPAEVPGRQHEDQGAGGGRLVDPHLARGRRGAAQRAGVVRRAGPRGGRRRERARLMKVYFLRHGKADRSQWDGDDDARPLTAEGEEAMRREAKALRALGLAPDVIVTSPLARARRTAELVADGLGLGGRVVVDDRLAPGFDVRRLEQVLAAHGPGGRRSWSSGTSPTSAPPSPSSSAAATS